MALPRRRRFVGQRCPGCDKLFDPADAVPVYECGTCGTTFGRYESSDGDSNRCPDCNRFGAKLHDGCPDGCADEPEDVDVDVCTKCELTATDCECDDEEVIKAMPEGRIDKLPRWAQKAIEAAKAEANELRRQIALRDGEPREDDIVVDPSYSDPSSARRLRAGSRVRFFVDRCDIDVVVTDRGDGDWLEIRSTDSGLVVKPGSGNIIYVRDEWRRERNLPARRMQS